MIYLINDNSVSEVKFFNTLVDTVRTETKPIYDQLTEEEKREFPFDEAVILQVSNMTPKHEDFTIGNRIDYTLNNIQFSYIDESIIIEADEATQTSKEK